MPRKFTPDELLHAEQLYASGKSFDQVAASLGRKSSEGIRNALARRGVVARPSHVAAAGHNRLDVPDDLPALYATEMSVLAMARHYGVSRGVITRWLRVLGLPVRNASEAGRIRMSRMTREERQALASAAHDAIREKGRTDEWQSAIAAGRERVQYGGRTSPGTDRLCQLLDSERVAHVREKAVGRYNVDIALPDAAVAVEVLGGNWHASKEIHARRTPDILNQGWHIVFVWDVKGCKVGAGALDYVIAFAEESRRNPAARREYRVIRGDGELLAAGHVNDDEFPLVPPSKANLNGRAGH